MEIMTFVNAVRRGQGRGRGATPKVYMLPYEERHDKKDRVTNRERKEEMKEKNIRKKENTN